MWSGEPMRCYECNSLSHIKWNCQLYVCPLCGQRQPGHAQKICPDRYHDDGTRGYFDIEGGKTSNYSRLKLWHHLCIYSGTWWFDYENSFFLSFLFIPYLNMFPFAFTWTFEFIPPTSILELAITPTFEQYYPPPILTKHPVWYSLNADFFISIWGILYGLHWQYFQNSPLFQEIVAHGEKQLVRLLPQHPIPFEILKNNLFDHFLVLLYHGSFKLNHLTRDNWIDLKQLCVDWYFPGQTAIIIQKFCDLQHCQFPPTQQLLVMSIPTQQIIRRLNWEEEQWQKVCLVQIEESDKESCVPDNST